MKKFICLALACLGTTAVWSDALDILKKADAVMLPVHAEFKWIMTVKKEGEEDRIDKFLCWKKGDLKYMFFHFWPEATYGQVMIRIDSTIWNYLPLADDTIKESYKSAFLGSDLSYADVMYNELALYYDVTVLDDSRADSVVLELKAKPGADGYARMVSIVDKKTFATLRREYFSKSGQLLKVIVFSDYQFQNLRVSAVKLTITQPLMKTQSTVAEFFDIQPKAEMKEQYFSLNFVKTFQPRSFQ